MIHSLSHQGITKDVYLRISGKTEEELLDEARPEAEQASSREAVLAAVVEAEGIDPADGDVLDALQTGRAAREDQAREAARASPHLRPPRRALKAIVAGRKAVDSSPSRPSRSIRGAGGGAEKLWTPETAQSRRTGSDRHT